MRQSLTSVDKSKSKTVVTGTRRTTMGRLPNVESEKSKDLTVKAKTVKTSIPLASKSPVISRKSIQTQRTHSRDLRQNLEDDTSPKSDVTVKSPVKDDISRRSTKTARTPPMDPRW